MTRRRDFAAAAAKLKERERARAARISDLELIYVNELRD